MTTVDDPAPLLSLHDVVKRFGGVVALDGIAFVLRAGEIHALLGENGAGKSTLIKILAGLHAPDAGTIFVDGQPTSITSVHQADRLGIRVIHQELTLAPNLTVAENIYLGREPTRYGVVQYHRMLQQAEQLLLELRLQDVLPASALVGSLSTAQQQLVEIARALSCRSRVLILDEPTASLSHEEIEALFDRLRWLRSQGVGIIYISHRLDEIHRLADRVTVLRDGRSMGTQVVANLERAQLIRWMVGREVADHYPRPATIPGDIVLDVRSLCATKVHGVSLTIRQGEILGLAGLIGSGRTELARALVGLNCVSSGTIAVAGQPVRIRSPYEARQHGIVMVPEDRKRQALILHRSAAFNAAWPWVDRWMRWIGPNRSRRAAIVQKVVDDFAVRVEDVDDPIGTLSGGNQQKIVVGRWMEEPPRVLILDEPTRGVDVGAREEMFRTIHGLAERGLAVLLISSDLPEVLALSHRVLVYRDGRIRAEFAGETATPDAVMAMLTGGEWS